MRFSEAKVQQIRNSTIKGELCPMKMVLLPQLCGKYYHKFKDEPIIVYLFTNLRVSMALPVVNRMKYIPLGKSAVGISTFLVLSFWL